jgi:hypothetical protein
MGNNGWSYLDYAEERSLIYIQIYHSVRFIKFVLHYNMFTITFHFQSDNVKMST